jgi:hypothetical protein
MGYLEEFENYLLISYMDAEKQFCCFELCVTTNDKES